jgi:hypothetical protein
MHGGKWHVAPDQEVDIDVVMRNYIEFNSENGILEGALVYKIQRKHAESVQYESKHIWLLVAWQVKHTKGSLVRALLAEYNKKLDENRLKGLYQKHWPSLRAQANTIRSNWTLNDATVSAISIKVMNGDYRWDIFISEGIKDAIKRKN